MSLRRFVFWAATAAIAAAMLAGCQRSRPRPEAAAPTPEEAARPPADLGSAVKALQQAASAAQLGEPLSVKTYLPDEMYEAINGEADLFLSYDCGGLAVARYQVGEATVDAEVFDQGEPLNAFGVYGSLRSEEAAPVGVGAESARVADDAVFFWQSRYFVRVAAGSAERPAGDVLVDLARRIAAGLGGSSALPAWTTALPASQEQGAPARYVARDVLGHGFLAHAIIGDYRVGEAECRLVVARADDEAQARDWQQRLQDFYHGALRHPDVRALGADAFAGADAQGRAVRAVRSGRYVVLVAGECDAAGARGLLSATLERLQEAGA